MPEASHCPVCFFQQRSLVFARRSGARAASARLLAAHRHSEFRGGTEVHGECRGKHGRRDERGDLRQPSPHR